MQVEILYFGVLREFFGVEHDRMELEDQASVEALLACLEKRGVGLPPVWGTMAVAVNREYVGRETLLREGDEVALLPPVSGGFR